MLGLPTGLRLVIDNGIANAFKHGRASQSNCQRPVPGAGVDIIIDDNGTGIPADERDRYVERFTGIKGITSDSGLGLRS